MNRKQFLQNSLIIGGASILPANSLLAASVTEGGIEKLIDKDGNFMQQTLPYAENFLEPYMDAETMHLHYTFHHGGAVKAANNDLKKIKEAILITWKRLTSGQRNYPFIFHRIFFIPFSGQTLQTKKLSRRENY